MSVKDKAAAIDRFVRTIKASGVYDDIQAACIMAGWTNLAGALYPLKGAAPTNNGFLDSDLDAGIGITGRSTNFIDSNFNTNLLTSQADHHMSMWLSSKNTVSGTTYPVINYGAGTSYLRDNETNQGIRCNSVEVLAVNDRPVGGKLYACKSESGTQHARVNGSDYSGPSTAQAGSGVDYTIFGAGPALNPTFACPWYSFGTATDLAALDSAVSTLMADLRAIDENGFDRDALAYIRNVEAADGAYLETSVKQAINAFVVGCKKDGIWDAIKASCIMCGARTISGALVPLVGPSPTAYPQPVNFVSADYDRSSGLKGDGATKYLDSNRAGNADGQDDHHLAVYMSSADTGSSVVGVGAAGVAGSTNFGNGSANVFARSRCAAAYTQSPTGFTGFMGISREEPSGYDYRYDSSTTPVTQASDGLLTDTIFIFARNESGTPNGLSSSRLTFYSIGSSLDLAALDNRVSTLVAAIGAAI